MYGCISFSCNKAVYDRHGCRFCKLTDRVKTDLECYICCHDHQCNYCQYKTCSGGCSLHH